MKFVLFVLLTYNTAWSQFVDHSKWLSSPDSCIQLLYDGHKQNDLEKVRAAWGDPKAIHWRDFSNFKYTILSIEIIRDYRPGALRGDAFATIRIEEPNQQPWTHWLLLRKLDGYWRLIEYSSSLDTE
jgi:hypothetical protein